MTGQCFFKRKSFPAVFVFSAGKNKKQLIPTRKRKRGICNIQRSCIVVMSAMHAKIIKKYPEVKCGKRKNQDG